MSSNFLNPILVLIGIILSIGTTIFIFFVQPASKESAKRCALYKLELFCPPNWGQFDKSMATKSLSKLYKHLQYASRGYSFIITRSAVWEMIKILDNVQMVNGKIIGQDCKKLYIWKTLIAHALGSNNMILLNLSSQLKYKKRLPAIIKRTIWVLNMYEKMNGSYNYNYELDLLNFKSKLLS